jgi:excisionase family DNA binding protein
MVYNVKLYRQISPSIKPKGKFNMSNRLLHDVDEAAEMSHVGPAKIREEIAAGRLAARKLGKRVLVTVEDLRAWIDAMPRVAA